MNNVIDDGIVDLMMTPCTSSVLNLNKLELRRLGYKVIHKTNTYVQRITYTLVCPCETNPMLSRLKVETIKDHLQYYAYTLENYSSGYAVINDEQIIKFWQESLDEIQKERLQEPVHLKHLFEQKPEK
jgi:hypothetical protein